MRASDRLLLTCSREVGFLPPAASPSIPPYPSHNSVIPLSLSTPNETHCHILLFLHPFLLFSSLHPLFILHIGPKPDVLTLTSPLYSIYTHDTCLLPFLLYFFLLPFSVTVPFLSSLVSLCSSQPKQSE